MALSQRSAEAVRYEVAKREEAYPGGCGAHGGRGQLWRAVRVVLALAAGLLGAAKAELKLDPIYESHMVLQRGCKVPIRGTCTSSSDIDVSYGDQKVKAKVKGKKWSAELEAMEADAEGKPLVVTQGKEKVELDDVVVGEVWLASGQSNMLWRLEQTGDQEAISHEPIAGLRFYHSEPQVHTDPASYSEELLERLKDKRMYEGAWHVSGPGESNRMSAVGWYFGKKLHEILGVPVGVVHASLGGSEMLAWMPTAVVKKKYRECMSTRWLESKYVTAWVRGRAHRNLGQDTSAPHPYKPSYLFETGIRPWCRFPFAGVIWYQGESDAEIQNQKQNEGLLENLINGWRTELHSPELPFIMVQLPRIRDEASKIRAYWPEFREVQDRVAKKLPKVYYVTTVDLGMTTTEVHPRRKLEVGERLAAMAAAAVYGKSDVPFSGPVAKNATHVGSKVVVEFDHAEGLKSADGKPIAHFELSVDGKKYHPAKAEVEDGKLVLTAEKMRQTPKWVRYAWATLLFPNLVNAAGLPTVPFTVQVR